jgi:transposase-like protein
MFREGAAIAGKNPKVIIMDGAHNYIDAARAFSTQKQKASHIREIRLTDTVHNNKMERMNGEIRDREKVMRSLKTKDTPDTERDADFPQLHPTPYGTWRENPCGGCGDNRIGRE